MGRPRLLPGALRLLLCLLPGTLAAGSHLSLLYHITAVTDPHGGTPSFFVSGWLGPQQYLSYSNRRSEAEPYGAWIWESQVSWYWEKETVDLKNKQQLFLEALEVLGEEPPSMRLKARPGSPGFSVLTCSAFSFYPPELQFGFLRNGMAAGSGEGGFGPNGDGSFYAWASLSVRSGDEYRYSCVVRHAGLPQPLSVALGEVPRLAFLPTPRARSCHSAGAWPPASEALPPQASCRPRLPAAPGSLPLLPPAPPRPVLPAPACLPSCCRRPAPTLIAPCLLLAPRDPPPRPQPRALGHRPPALPLPRAARAWEGPGAPQLPEAAHGLLPCRLATPSPR
uniref:IgG receptor FcRn large subunit p51 n=1 Tax=Oryctolagus cuniculus TaxID=9986 RepID=A0A5F9DL26_RABIT